MGTFFTTDRGRIAARAARAPGPSWMRAVVRFVVKRPLGAASALVVGVDVALALAGPWAAPYGPNHIMPEVRLAPPSWRFPMGTDQFGRDVLSQLLHGARVSVVVGFASTLLGSVAGGAVGLIAGYRRGWLDDVLVRVMDMLMVFPTLILALATVAVLGASLQNLIAAVALPIVPRVARVVRSQVLALRESTYIEAARAVGCAERRVLWRHLLPNSLSIFLVMMSSFLGKAILAEASLNFLGLGLPPNIPTWGNMLGNQAAKFFEMAPWMALWPGVAISVTVLSFNLLGDAVTDAIDPRLR
jgi:peptide/nickel transport system permease protein